MITTTASNGQKAVSTSYGIMVKDVEAAATVSSGVVVSATAVAASATSAASAAASSAAASVKPNAASGHEVTAGGAIIGAVMAAVVLL